MKFALAASISGLLLMGCHSTLKSGDGTADAEINLGKDGLTLNSDDGKGGSANLSVGSAKIDIHDDHGGVQMEAGPNTFKMKARGEDGSFENNVSVGASQLTVPTYPGSKEVPIASMRATNKSEDVFISTRTTSDDPKSVMDFYRGELRSDKIIETTKNDNGHQKFELKGKSKSGRDIGISAEQSNYGDHTTIVVASGTKED